MQRFLLKLIGLMRTLIAAFFSCCDDEDDNYGRGDHRHTTGHVNRL